MSRRSRNVQLVKTGQEHRRELAKLMREASYSHAVWQIWDDLMYFVAAALAQPMKWVQAREDEYLRRIGHYDKKTIDLFTQMFAEIVLAFEQEGFVDVLGDMYMQLELFNRWKGQYFTPSHICDFMAKITDNNLSELVEKQGYISVNDPCCGGGAMLMAFAKNAQEQGIHYQRDVLYVGQDIDPVVARMCYISMSLLGLGGYVIIGNSLTHPPTEPMTADYEIWFTPMYFVHGFQWRWQRNEPIHADGGVTPAQDEETGAHDSTPEAAEIVPQPTQAPPAPDVEYKETKVGQLTLF